MNIKPNRPLRVGNKMLRSGAADSDFMAEVEAELSAVAPVDENAMLRELAAGIIELQQLVVTQKADADQQIADLTEALAVSVTAHEALQVDLAAVTECVATLETALASAQGQISLLVDEKQGTSASGGSAKKPAAKAADKVLGED